MWRLAKSMTSKQMLKDQIRTKKTLLTERKRAFEAKIDAIEQQLKMKKEILRQHKRRLAMDPGADPAREDQKNEFKLYNRLRRDTEKEIKGLEKEIEATKKEKQASVKALESEIKALEMNLKIY